MYQSPIDDKTKERFWSKVDKRGVDECWEWIAAKQNKHRENSYGIFWFRGHNIGAHRMAYLLHHGYLDSSLYVCHECDNPKCVNPHHLFQGTALDNQQDMIRKGRQVIRPLPKEYYTRGTDVHCAKLTPDKVKQARKLWRPGKRGYGIKSLANRFGVSKSTMSGILKRKTWKHVN